MLSRVADNLYWMSRYLERAEHAARVLEVNLSLNLERRQGVQADRWQELLSSLRHPLKATKISDVIGIIKGLSFDKTYHSSIVSYIEAARENARQVREQISSEMWEQINLLYLSVQQRTFEDIWDDEPGQFFRNIRNGSHLFQGITDSTMSHGEGWHFIQIGRFVERADMTAQWLSVKASSLPDTITSAEDFLEWVGLLKGCTAYEAYCKVYTADLQPAQAAEFLLFNREFPRSIRFCVDRLQEALNGIAEETDAPRNGKVNRMAGKLRASVDFTNIDEVLSSGLDPFLHDLQDQVNQINNVVFQTYITYSIEAAIAG